MLDLALVHAPSVYDFRRLKRRHYGPISDVVPSKPVFDMYPAGFFSLASYLEERGFRVGIYNLAARMLCDPGLDAERFLRGIKARVYGVDLHWFVHAHGAIEVARLLKEIHGAPVFLGGLSTTIFWREILERYPWIDATILGDTTEPIVLAAVEAYSEGREERLERLTNIAFRRDGRIIYRPPGFVPESLDEYRPKYKYVVKSFVRSGVLNALPWSSFLEHPVTAIISFKGCTYNCVTCGGSSFCYRRFMARQRLGVKSPEIVLEEFREITERIRAPLFFVGDLTLLGEKYVERLTDLLSREAGDVEVFFELFKPPPRRVLEMLRRVSPRVYLQISPESPNEKVRRAFGRPYGNEELLRFLRAVGELDFQRIDLYFMVGLPYQDEENVRAIGPFFKQAYTASKGKATAFVAPLAPFVDPGSLAYVYGEKLGYRLLARSVEEHRRLLMAPTWYEMLNYETLWLDRPGIARATYNAAEELARAKHEAGVMGDEEYEKLLDSIERARRGLITGIVDEKETVSEEELYPGKKRLPISTMTPRLIAEVAFWTLALRLSL